MKSTRYPLYRQVHQYRDSMGTILAHLKCYSDADAEATIDAFKRINGVMYEHYMSSLMAERPLLTGKPSTQEELDKCLAHNDSVHALREHYNIFKKKSRQLMEKRFGH